jgi:hypothetical protein
MSKVKVICPNHGIVQEIEMACMWIGNPPMPEIDFAFCSKCGSKTVIERDKNLSMSYMWTYKDEYKDSEVKFYREKYKKEFGLENGS